MDSSDSKKADKELRLDTAELEHSTTVDAPSANNGLERSPSDQAEGADAVKGQGKQGYRKRRKLYQAIARIEGALKIKGEDLVIVTKGDKAEFQVAWIGGQYTAMRLLKRPANRRQGFYTLYPHSQEQSQIIRLINFNIEVDTHYPDVPPTDRMFVSGKLVRKEEDAFFVDVGRNRRTHRAKKQIYMPLKIAGMEADPNWNSGQWIGLVLHRQGTDWIWTGETRAVLKSGIPKANKGGEKTDDLSSSSSAADET